MGLPFQHRLIGRHAPIVPGSASYTAPGTYYLTIPYHRTMTFDVRGAGGGGGGSAGAQQNNPQPPGNPGGDGTYSQSYYAPNSGLLNVIGYPGKGGAGGVYGTSNTSNGANGSAAGGDSHYPGAGAGGGAGGWEHVISYFGSTESHAYYYAGNGGAGGRSVRSISRGLLVPGQTLVIIVGSAGGPGAPGSFTWPYGDQHAAAAGGNGAVYISWT